MLCVRRVDGRAQQALAASQHVEQPAEPLLQRARREAVELQRARAAEHAELVCGVQRPVGRREERLDVSAALVAEEHEQLVSQRVLGGAARRRRRAPLLPGVELALARKGGVAPVDSEVVLEAVRKVNLAAWERKRRA